MNGLLTIYKKQESSSTLLRQQLNKGLKSLSHRGSNICTSFLINKEDQVTPVVLDLDQSFSHQGRANTNVAPNSDIPKTFSPKHSQGNLFPSYMFNENVQDTDSTETTAQIIMGSCSSQKNESHIASHDGNILFFEGRLLNKAELCKQLSIIPENNITDSAIVLQLLENGGTNCLKTLKGFWSLIYFDCINKYIYGARDHFGNRTMYFCNTNSQFALASESRTLYSLFKDARRINKNTVTDFLLWGNIGQMDQYFFNDILSIEPSHFVKFEIDTNSLTVEPYFTLPYNHSKMAYSKITEQQYINKFRSFLSDSVRDNIGLFVGAIAVGVSGGMDSSSLICTAKKTNPDRTLVAYTATDNYDGGEANWAEMIVRHTGAEWIKVVCTPEHIIEKLDTVNRVHSTPLYNASSLAQFRIMEEIKKQGQVTFLDGQGGDELLGGYPAYFPLFLKSLRKNGEWRSWWNELSKVDNTGMTKKEIYTRRLKLWAKAHYYKPKILAQKKRRYEFESLMPQIRDKYFKQPSPLPQIKKDILNDALFENYTVFLGNILRWGEH